MLPFCILSDGRSRRFGGRKKFQTLYFCCFACFVFRFHFITFSKQLQLQFTSVKTLHSADILQRIKERG